MPDQPPDHDSSRRPARLTRPFLAWLLALGLAMSGCATLDQDECLNADWYALGARDGRQGQSLDYLDRHREACNRHGIRPDTEAYLDGRRIGLEDYCQIDNAARVGLDGQRYEGVCTGPMDLQFRRVHAAAYDLHQARKEQERIDRQLRDKEKQLREDRLSDRDRSLLREEIRDLDRKRDRLRSDVLFLERELDRLLDAARRRVW